MSDTITIEILDDGRVRIETDSFSPAQHRNADELMALLESMGATTKTKKPRKSTWHAHGKEQPHRH